MKKIKIVTVVLTTFFACLFFYGFFIESQYLDITHLYPENPALKAKLKGKTAVHLTDLHMKEIGSMENKVINLLMDIKPDFIFLTGDYVKWDGNYDAALAFLSRLNAKEGVYAVMGDYDYSNSRKSCLFCHKTGTGQFADQHHVRFLRNSKTDIGLEEDKVIIAGIDKEYDDEVNDITGADIILTHNPISFDEIENKDEVMVLSGDTHGGQIPLPSWFWGFLGYEKNAKYNHGLFKDGQKVMYVNRGIGTSHIRFRLFRRPEVLVLHF